MAYFRVRIPISVFRTDIPPHFASNDRLLLLPDVGKRAPILVFPKKECCWSPRGADLGIGEKVFITVAIMFSKNETKENGALVQRPSTATPPAIIAFHAFPPGFVLKPYLYAGVKHVEII